MGERRYVYESCGEIFDEAGQVLVTVNGHYAHTEEVRFGCNAIALVPLSELGAMEKALAHVNKCIASNPIEAAKLLGSDYGSVGLGVTKDGGDSNE